MAASEEIVCPMCGGKNPAAQERCQSCGAKLGLLTVSYTAEELHARRHQQEDFEWKWALIAALLFSALQGIVLGLLPALIHAYDPQGLPGLMLSVPVALVGGLVMGLISPGKTFLEPAAGSIIAAMPTLALVASRTPEGFEPTALAYIVCAAMGVMTALFGAFLGEKLQMGSAPVAPSAKKR